MQEYSQPAEQVLILPPNPSFLRGQEIKIPGLENLASEFSKLNQTCSQLPQKCREEASALVSSIEDRWHPLTHAHNVGFLNGAICGLIAAVISCYLFSRKKNGP